MDLGDPYETYRKFRGNFNYKRDKIELEKEKTIAAFV
jgi:hypothetical protein